MKNPNICSQGGVRIWYWDNLKTIPLNKKLNSICKILNSIN